LDTLTHALSGALLARATAPAALRPEQLNIRLRTTIGFLSAIFPDSDFILRLVDTLTYLNFHQGITHSIILLPLWAMLLSVLLSYSTHKHYPWQAFFGIVSLGIAIHILGDLFTAYGTMIFAPFTSWRISLPIIFVLDPYFSAIIVAGLVASFYLSAQRQIARITLIILVCYVGLQVTLHQQAVRVGEEYAKNNGLNDAISEALPQPILLSNWKVIVSHNNNYHVSLINLIDDHSFFLSVLPTGVLSTIINSYQPVSKATWKTNLRMTEPVSKETVVYETWNQAAFSDFRHFARYPTHDHVETNGSRVCVWFADLRFTLPGIAPSFRYGLCRSGISEQWILEQKHGDFYLD
jgi:inner membrane protein